MYKIYKVSMGDTLSSIAKKFNTTIDNLQNINGIDYINMGELIIVPNNSIILGIINFIFLFL